MRDTYFSRSSSSSQLLSGTDLSAFLEVGRRRKWWVILTALGLFVCTVVVVKRMPDIYRAETVILVDSQQVPDKYVADITTGDIAGRLTTLQQQVLSPTRLKTLVESEGLYPDPTGRLSEKQVIKSVQKSITVELINPGAGKLGSFRIAFSAKDRTKVASIANELARMFIDANLNARQEQTAGTAEFLESQLAETKQQLDEKDSQLRAIKTRNIMELPESRPYHIEALANLRGQVQAIQDKMQASQREKSVLQSMLVSGTDAPTVDVDGQATADGGTGNPYQAQLQTLETKLSNLRSRYGPGHPDVRKTQDEINKLQTKIAAAAANPDSTSAQPVHDARPAIQSNPKRHNPVIEAQIEELNEQMQDQEKQLIPLQRQLDSHTADLQQIPVFEQQIGRLQQDYDILKAQYKDLQDKEAAAKISNALEIHEKGDRFVVLDSAVTPESPASPDRLLISLGGLVGGLLGGIALAVLAEMSDESVRTEREVARTFGQPVLTEVPLVITGMERHSRRLRIAAMVTSTLVGSAALGFVLSFVAGRFF